MVFYIYSFRFGTHPFFLWLVLDTGKYDDMAKIEVLEWKVDEKLQY